MSSLDALIGTGTYAKELGGAAAAPAPFVEATIATTPATVTDEVMVLVGAEGSQLQAGPCRWEPRPVAGGLLFPARGDRCLVVTGDTGHRAIVWWEPQSSVLSAPSAASPTYQPPQAADRLISQIPNLLAYWRFNERSGAVVYDDLRTHDATLTPATAKLGCGALTFSDGRTGLKVTATGTIATAADQGASDTLRLVQKPYSIGWFGRVNALPASYAVMASKESNGPSLLMGSNGSVTLSWFDGTSKSIATSAGKIVPGGLYLIGASMDGTTARIYINGRELASAALTDAGIFSVNAWTMLADSAGGTPVLGQTAGVFVAGEVLAAPWWDALWSALVAAPSFSLGKPAKFVRFAQAGNPDLSNPVSDAARYDIIVVHPWRTAYRDAVKAANPNCKVLAYQEVAAMSTSRDTSGLSASAVNYDEAGNAPASDANAAAGPNQAWFLRSTATGLPFTFSAFNYLYAADIGHAGYRARVTKNLRTLLTNSAWDGVFLDDVNVSLKYHHTVSDVTQYPNDAAYTAAMRSLLAYATPMVEGLGKLCLANLGSGHEFPDQVTSWLDVVGGGLDEYPFAFGSPATFQLEPSIDNAIVVAQEMQRRGRHALLLSAVDITANVPNAAQARYYLAASLLVQEGRAYCGVSEYINAPWNSAEWDGLDWLGVPVEKAVKEPTSTVWRRRYSGGIVYLNPGATGRTVTFAGTFSGNGLAPAQGATVPAHGALILRSA